MFFIGSLRWFGRREREKSSLRGREKESKPGAPQLRFDRSRGSRARALSAQFAVKTIGHLPTAITEIRANAGKLQAAGVCLRDGPSDFSHILLLPLAQRPLTLGILLVHA